MTSQTDLDQGGTFREWVRTFMGPSVGWVMAPRRNVLPITLPGTYQLDRSTSLVTVNCAGLVTIILPTAIVPVIPAGAQPGDFVHTPITIVDIGGFASDANPITLEPFQGVPAENIMNLASIQLTAAYGGYTLTPNSSQRGWTTIQ